MARVQARSWQSVHLMEASPKERAYQGMVYRCIKSKYNFFVNDLHGVLKCSRKINRITQIDCKSRDESNKPN